MYARWKPGLNPVLLAAAMLLPATAAAQISDIDITPIPRSLTDFLQQDAFGQVGLLAAHATATGAGERIAVIDGGFDLTHEAIDASRIVAKWDYVDQDIDPSDVRDGYNQDGQYGPDEMFGHGTAVLSLISALAPGAELLVYRVMDEEGQVSTTAVALAILDAVEHGASAINVSLSFSQDDPALRAAVASAAAAGILIVAPSGNTSGVTCTYPGAYSEVICVGGVDLQDQLLAYANGPDTELLAPADQVLVAYNDSPGGYGVAHGPSYAAPFVTATAALVKEAHPALTPDGVRQRLRQCAVQLSLTQAQQAAGVCGRRLDALAAVAP